MESDIFWINLDKKLKILLLLCFIVLLVVMRVYKMDSCDLIKEDTQGLNQGQVVSLYYEKCLKQYKVSYDNPNGNFNFSNLTILQP